MTVGTNTRVTGRTAYDLILSPRSADTLIGSVSIAVDSQTGLPLSVDVQARGQKDAAFSLAFTSLTLEKPAADLFAFVAPKGATVKEQTLPTHKSMPPNPDASSSPTSKAAPEHTVIGTGWDSVLALPAGTLSTKVSSAPLYSKATSAVAGGRVLHTELVNIFLTDDGRVFAGSAAGRSRR
ncbi:MAG: LolA family protein [Lacisediminihabitans sp.]